MKTYTREDVVAAIQKEIDKTSLRQTAKRIGISAGYLSDVLKGNRHVSETMAGAFGFTREVVTQFVFRKIA